VAQGRVHRVACADLGEVGYAAVMSTSRLVAAAAFLTVVGIGTRADAQMIIKTPGDHPEYKVELSPHLDFGWTNRYYASSGFGLGFRATIPIVQNGFIPNLNNSVGISFGLDWLRYSGCYGAYYNGFDCGGASYFLFPVAMQWNFWLTPHFSVFGEPGFYIYHGVFDDYCNDPRFKGTAFNCGYPTRTGVDFALWGGGRYHFNDTIALTARIGYPTFDAGVSFLF
jgi:hypothetical protein